MSAAKQPRRRQIEDVDTAALAQKLGELVVAEDGSLVKIGGCIWYQGDSLEGVKTVDEFIVRIIISRASNQDVSCFGGKYGILYTWLYLFHPEYFTAGADICGELAIRLGLLLIEYNSFVTPTPHHEDADVYLKYTEFALKRVCIDIIMHLVRVRKDPSVDVADLEVAYKLYSYERENIPMLRLIAMALKHTHDADQVSLFATKFGNALKQSMPKQDFISAFYALGKEVSRFLSEKYPQAQVDAVVLVESETKVAGAVTAISAVSAVNVEVTATETVIDLSPEPEPTPPPKIEEVEQPIPEPTLEAAGRADEELIFPSDISHADANVKCCACGDSQGEPQNGRSAETEISLTEGRFAGCTEAAVTYVALNQPKDDHSEQRPNAWFNMPPPPPTKKSPIDQHQRCLVNFIQKVIAPIDRMESDLIHDLAYTLATLKNAYARNAAISFVCNEFISNDFSGGALAAYEDVQAAFKALLKKQPEFSSSYARANIATIIVMQTAKQMIDADEAEERPLSANYSNTYGMLKHVVSHVQVVESMFAQYSATIKKMKKGSTVVWIRRVEFNITGRIIRRIRETLYAARVQYAGRWSEWKNVFVPYYDGLRFKLLERFIRPVVAAERYSEEDPTLTGGYKLKTITKEMKVLIAEVESMRLYSVKASMGPLSFRINTPDIPITLVPAISGGETGGFLPLPEGAERAAESAIKEAIKSTHAYIDGLEEEHPRTDLRIALSEMLSKRAFFGNTLYECLLSKTETPFDLYETQIDYTCGGAFRNEFYPNTPITNMQSYLAELLEQQKQPPV
jgi:hypothetical protein